MIVLDASAVLDLLLRRPAADGVAALLSEHEGLSLELLVAEVLHGLRRFEHRGELSPERAKLAFEDFVDLPVELEQHRPEFREVTRGAVKADPAERDRNARSASVRLRAAERIRPRV